MPVATQAPSQHVHAPLQPMHPPLVDDVVAEVEAEVELLVLAPPCEPVEDVVAPPLPDAPV